MLLLVEMMRIISVTGQSLSRSFQGDMSDLDPVMKDGMPSPRRRFFKTPISVTPPQNTIVTSKKITGLLSRKRGSSSSASASISLTFQLDTTRNHFRNQRDFPAIEIQEMKGFSSPDVLAKVKSALSQAHKSVTFFNSRYYQGNRITRFPWSFLMFP